MGAKAWFCWFCSVDVMNEEVLINRCTHKENGEYRIRSMFIYVLCMQAGIYLPT